MSTTTRTAPASRLPRPAGPGGGRGWELLRGTASALVLLVLLAGVPAALVLLVGNPLPTSPPTRDWLTSELTTAAVVQVLAVALWLAWLHFAACVLVEFRAWRHGGPARTPWGGGSQVLAQRLVAGVLLLSSAGVVVAPAASAAAPAPQRVVATVVADAAAPAPTAVAQDRDAAGETGPATASVSVGEPRWYEVRPPQGRQHDCLWDIAERTLGDPLRYREIYELNRDRIQADGGRLADANLLRAGWTLLLPADARGDGVVAGVAEAPVEPVPAELAPAEPAPAEAPSALAEVPAAAPAATVAPAPPAAPTEPGWAAVRPDAPSATPAPAASATPAPAATATPAPAATATPAPAATATPAPAATMDGGGGLLLPEGLHPAAVVGTALGGLLAAAAGAALVRRRGSYGTPDAVEAELRASAGGSRADLLCAALGELAAVSVLGGVPLPRPVAAHLGDDELSLHLAAAPRFALPAPWRTPGTGTGRTWNVHRDDLMTPAGAAAGLPGSLLVAVATAETGETVLVDLAAAGGLVAVGGDLDLAREAVVALALGLAASPWCADVAVVLAGFAGEPAALAAALAEPSADRVRSVTSLDEVLAGTAAAGRRQVVLMSAPPTHEQLAVAAAGDLVLVCVGDAPGARWRFAVDHDGSIDLGVLGIRGTALRAASRETAALTAALRRAGAAAGAGERAVAAAAASGHLLDALAGEGAPQSTGERGLPAGAGAAPADCTVSLLGPVLVLAPGPEPRRRGLATELVCAAALHRGGVHEAVWRAALWPHGTSDAEAADLEAQTRAWLGATADGLDRLERDAEGRLRLRDVGSDWARFRAAVDAAATAAGPEAELDRLLQALRLLRGGPLGCEQPGRYGWLAAAAFCRDARALGSAVALRAADLAVLASRPADAQTALEAGLRLVPQAQGLWRALLRSAGSAEDAADAAGRMLAALGAVPLEEESALLLGHLQPGASRPLSA
ncbi:hypothetical protein CLV92_101475 [Kineococcus xinjiangensis]|uniref:Bacterial transcriptional activator domain-containing protein n=1 Tax=Kineococcus xinjiangensis TaxID=512762 RepID=A0A2S6IWP8_9ACTN|nr:hypothetical protein [Kineococcus xinjiangensis]PPK98774.1 hypothetical protein CLV92_101475 [Kineococcus xinjiangensis]